LSVIGFFGFLNTDVGFGFLKNRLFGFGFGYRPSSTVLIRSQNFGVGAL
jgi:hypothetical protein